MDILTQLPGALKGHPLWFGPGWTELLAAFDETVLCDTLVMDVERKNGGLKIATRNSDFASGAAAMARTISYFTCEDCGKFGRRIEVSEANGIKKSGEDWETVETFLTRCEAHRPRCRYSVLNGDSDFDFKRVTLTRGLEAIESGLSLFIEKNAQRTQVTATKIGAGYEFSSRNPTEFLLGGFAFASNYSFRISNP